MKSKITSKDQDIIIAKYLFGYTLLPERHNFSCSDLLGELTEEDLDILLYYSKDEKSVVCQVSDCELIEIRITRKTDYPSDFGYLLAECLREAAYKYSLMIKNERV